MKIDSRRTVVSWALYDWANSAFATTVMAGFFPLFFNRYWSSGADTTVTTARLGLGNSAAGLLVVLLAPVLGALADRGCVKKRFLIFFAYFGAVMTSSLYFVSRGEWAAAVIIYVLASIGFSGSLIFYDALLKSVASEKQADVVSSLGYSLGYLGGGLLFAANVWLTLNPERFGISDPQQAIRVSLLSAGLWWALFTVPLLINVREEKSCAEAAGGRMITGAFRELSNTFRSIKKRRFVFLFLVAYWFYIDGVDTIVRMAVDYGLSIGLVYKDLIVALLITQFVGFPSALVFGAAGKKLGAIRCIFFSIGVYLLVSIFAAFIRDRSGFYTLAVLIGLVQGGIQSLSRAHYSRMIPAGKSAEYFGFYNMVGKFSVVIGPFFIGMAGLAARSAGFSENVSSRLSISSISLLFVIGAVILRSSVRSYSDYSRLNGQN